MSPTEKELDEAFAKTLQESPTFVQWLVSQTRFRAMSQDARLLHEELAAARGLPTWWRHWWFEVPDWGQSETDIFAVFEAPTAQRRFAIHIENKKANGKFTARQAEMYRARAAYMMTLPRCPRHEECTTMLLAPRAFLRDYRHEALKFDSLISHEDVSTFVPAFGL